jgi:hypothetical protein
MGVAMSPTNVSVLYPSTITFPNACCECGEPWSAEDGHVIPWNCHQRSWTFSGSLPLCRSCFEAQEARKKVGGLLPSTILERVRAQYGDDIAQRAEHVQDSIKVTILEPVFQKDRMNFRVGSERFAVLVATLNEGALVEGKPLTDDQREAAASG